MVSPVLIAAAVTILPAMGALWYLLRRYEEYFEDNRVFLALTVGFFAGLAVIAMEIILFPFQDPRFIGTLGEGGAFLFFVVGYAIVETGAKVIVLGSKRFRKRKDTPYYGAALGLGFGAMMALGFVAINLNVATTPYLGLNNTTIDPGGYSTPGFLAMALVPLGAIFVHGAAGVYVGRSSANDNLWRGWAIGTLLQMPVLGAFWLFWPSIGDPNATFWGPAAISLAYGVLLMHIARIKILDQIVPKEILDKLRRERRREARLAAQADGDEEE